MNRQIWGVALFVLGLLVAATGLLDVVQMKADIYRWIYIGLGAYLVVRGLYVWWPFSRKKNSD